VLKYYLVHILVFKTRGFIKYVQIICSMHISKRSVKVRHALRMFVEIPNECPSHVGYIM